MCTFEEVIMSNTQIFALQVIVNLVIYGLVARWYVAPWLANISLPTALTPLLLFHMLRTMGVTFIIPGVVGSPLPSAFAVPGAYGDLLAVTLAFAALVVLQFQQRLALGIIWLFNIVGTLDFIYAFIQGIRLDIAERYQLGPVWFIPTFYVPAAMVVHMLVFWLLLTRVHETQAQPTQKLARSQV
jgi:hypothetical protein